MRKVGFVYDDVFLKHKNPPGHPESGERLVHTVNVLRASDVWDRLVHIKPRRASYEEILHVHTPEYVEGIKKFTGYADPDTFVSGGSVEAALYAAGAVIEAIDRCGSGEIHRAFCAVRPPGHHAEADRAMGFCIFNNVAVGARHAQKAGYKRVFIVDFDVHHGNGTQHMFEEDPDVFYFSTHQSPHYPGTGGRDEKGRGKGEGTTANHPMPSGSGVKEYSAVYHGILPGLMKNFSPDIVLVSAGYDILSTDPLAGINVSVKGVGDIVRGILSSPKEIPAVFTLEGGYNLQGLADSVLLTLRELLTS